MAWDISFQHVFKEGNMTADWFAKRGSASQDVLTILDQCPTALFSQFMVIKLILHNIFL